MWSFLLTFVWKLIESEVLGVLTLVFVVGIVGLAWEACIRVARPLRVAFDLVRRPLAYGVMRAERDQARAAFEASAKISSLRADAARRMAEVRGEPHA